VQDAKRRINDLNVKRNGILKKLKEKYVTKDISQNIKSLFKGGASEYQYKAAIEKDIDEQEKIHLEGIKKYPDDINLLNNYGIYLTNNRKYEKAIKYFQKVIEIQPNTHYAFNNWGIALGSLARTKSGKEADALYQEAFEKYNKSKDINPTNHIAFNNWGYDLGSWAKTKSEAAAEVLWEEAIEKCQKAINLGGMKYTLARVYALIPDKEKGFSYLEKSLKDEEITINSVLKNEIWQPYLKDKDFKKLIQKYKDK